MRYVHITYIRMRYVHRRYVYITIPYEHIPICSNTLITLSDDIHTDVVSCKNICSSYQLMNFDGVVLYVFHNVYDLQSETYHRYENMYILNYRCI